MVGESILSHIRRRPATLRLCGKSLTVVSFRFMEEVGPRPRSWGAMPNLIVRKRLFSIHGQLRNLKALKRLHLKMTSGAGNREAKMRTNSHKRRWLELKAGAYSPPRFSAPASRSCRLRGGPGRSSDRPNLIARREVSECRSHQNARAQGLGQQQTAPAYLLNG